MFETLVDHMSRHAFFAGDKLSAADILWGTALHWMTMFKLIPERPVIADFVARITARPAYGKVMKEDQELAAAHQAAVEAAKA